ncbi:ribbon-helix-helix protein, CopG family [Thermus amyloliquefaciens]|uniref:ribbon-helix-helix protein, CopG family n=1 Tax=Thermus amyloliquefaciens TaxID=1449080 RepID=UPI000A61C0CE|nr:ribbon-helix-helix protein, CopG family [Thermus amyloliquefaciens]
MLRYHEGMVRTQVQLPEEQAQRLRALAQEEGVSLAELVRRAAGDPGLWGGGERGLGPDSRRCAPAVLTALSASGRREISLVDWTSFFFMQRRGLRKALAFDEGFWEQGFSPVDV